MAELSADVSLLQRSVMESEASPESITSGNAQAAVQRRNSVRRGAVMKPYSGWRLVWKVTLHLVAFSAECTVILFFGLCSGWKAFGAVLATACFSGLFCTYAAWHCSTPSFRCTYLPLKNQSIWVKMLLVLPLGLGQGVVVALALEDHYARRKQEQTQQASEPGQVNSFGLKAVNGIFEGIISATIVLFNYWGLGVPNNEHPVTHCPDWSDKPKTDLLKTLGIILLISGGMGLLELDAAVSTRIARRMKRSTFYEILHLLYRTSEVICRCSLISGLMVLFRSSSLWGGSFHEIAIFPVILDWMFVMSLVLWYGGSETSHWVRLLIGTPCVFANVFRFIDSPYKKRAARRISFWLNLRHFVEVYLLPLFLLVYLRISPNGFLREFNYLLEKHSVTTGIGFIAAVLYWPLHWFVGTAIQRDSPADIFTACESNDADAVTVIMRQGLAIDVNCYDIGGKTPLMLAVMGSRASDADRLARICRMLIQDGAKVDLRVFADTSAAGPFMMCGAAPLRRRWTVLHMAAWKGCSEEVIRELLLGVSEADAQGAGALCDSNNETPLHVAVKFDRFTAAQTLAKARPEWLSARNHSGQRPCELARTQEMEAILTRQAQPQDPLLAASELDESLSRSRLWPQVILQISMTTDNNRLAAPGLCSFIASNAGGPLGRHFCQALPVPSNESSTIEGSLVSDVGAVEAPAAATFAGNSGVASGSGGGLAMPSFKRASTEPASAKRSPVRIIAPSIDELEPITKDGTPFQFWVQEMTDRRRRGGRAVGAGFATLMPDEAILGSGTYGVVWRARNRRDNSVFAVKNVRAQHERVATLATRENQVADRVRLQPHPCIVGLYLVHHFQEVNLFMQVMEFCSGGDLLSQIERHRRRADVQSRPYETPPLSAQWIGQVFLGLEHLHLQMRALLRDLKPDNVVLNAEGCAKLTDFGFGRFGAESRSNGAWTFGCPPGSPGYISPEILKQEAHDFKADLYSFGVLIWVLYSGGVTYDPHPRPPWGQAKDASDFKAHLQDFKFLKDCLDKPETNGAIKIPEDVKLVVYKLTQRRPRDRPDHQAIRRLAFMQALHMPELKAGRDEVERWIEAIQLQG